MSTITPIAKPLPGERVAALSPGDAIAAATDWLRRPNLFAGRALTAPTLEGRQRWQAGRIAQRGQAYSAGVVQGLELSHIALPAVDETPQLVRLFIEPGQALAASGEDILLVRRLECRLADVPVVAQPAWFTAIDPGNPPPPIPDPAPGQTHPRAIGSTLASALVTAGDRMSRIGVLLLQPVTMDVSPLDPDDPCDRCGCGNDTAAFEDWRVGDGARLLWYPWPEEWLALPVSAPARLRNALATTLFSAEAALAEGAVLPWAEWGVPITVVALDAAAAAATAASVAPAFSDRAAVVRQGGRARDARVAGSALALNADSRLPLLWQARIEQFAGQLAEMAGSGEGQPLPPLAQLADPFLRLPPVGLLPKVALDFTTWRSDFFPPGITLDAVPVPIEQLDVAIRDAAALAPIDLSAPERVRLLVPVTQASFEPRLLQTERIDPEFQQTLDRFVLTRSRELGARQGLRNEVALLGRILSGQPQKVPAFNDDPLAVEPESLAPWGPPPAGGGHRSALRSGLHQHFFDSATETLTPAAADNLFAWVYLDPEHLPRTLMLQWRTGVDWEHRAFWGEDLIPWGAADSAGQRRIGDLPEAGRWLMLEVPARSVGLAAVPINGISFALFDGQAAYAMTGSRSGGNETKWFCNVLPAGARVQGDEPFEMLTHNDLWAPFEPARGVIAAIPASVPGVGSSTTLLPGGHVEPLRSGIHQHFFEGAAPFSAANDPLLYAWVYLDPNDPPREVMLQWQTAGNWEHRAFWGWDLIAWGIAGNARRRVGGLPLPGEWVRLALPLASVGLDAATPISGMAFALFDGTAAFGPAGAMTVTTGTDATGATVTTVTERPWFAGALPLRAQPRGTWQFLDARELYAPTATSRVGKVQAVRDLLADPLLAVLSDQERAQLTVRGLAPFVAYLRERIDRADDLTDYGFVKMQSDVYRLRQLMLGGTDATRIGVSPALAAIAKADTAVATQAQIASYVAELKKPVTTAPSATASATASATSAATAAASAAATESLRAAAANVGKATANLNFDLLSANLLTGKGISALQQTPPRTTPPAVAAVVAQATFQPIYRANQFSPIDVVLSNPVIGKSAIRTTAIADRLKQPASQEARDYALSTRHEAMLRLLGLVDEFTTEDGGMLPGLFDGFDVHGLAGDPFLGDLNANNPAPGNQVRRRKLTDFRSNPALLNLLLDSPGRTATDEGTLFSETADMSDNTVALLRQVEGRLARYRNALTRCEFALTDLQNEQVNAAQRLDAAGDRLAEARHDVAVARALIAEEQARLAAINARRTQVLAQEVRFIAFMRVRELPHALAAPRRVIDPALAEAPVPACLRGHDDVPDELDDMLRVVREAPASWFVRTPRLFDRLDRSDLLLRTLRSAQLRGTLLAQRAIAAPLVGTVGGKPGGLTTGKLAGAVTQVVARQTPTLATRIAAVSAINLTTAAALTWQGLRVQVPQVLSFGDLIDGDHGKGAVSRDAAAEFDRIARICACLHAEFCGVSAAIRLDWAELMSEFDDAPNLRNGANLPRWSEIDSTDRRQMQAYLDWLFAQVDPAISAAVALVNDLIRMALLLASHAPVGRIVAGRLLRPVTAVRPGVRIALVALDLSAKLRVGMQAVVYRESQLLARAVVEDIGGGEVSARVLYTSAAQVDLATDMRVHFDQAAVVSAAAAQRALTGR